ncbi:glycosyltransferase family 2 protein [Pseudothauera nasutitermitis]|uniref:Glycosyltransferase family 2 protein n=1 Tax=Pseudothauera nasutitermitis TaxID=2565930 RepID=A0A4S4AUL0_9RHOO|nr:glycosyltransferase family A protein [Pseudothauera nasutitermitis]THF63651.1 glycosyltransferase family 2 protein [Pseudothauera nasutitermitis]
MNAADLPADAPRGTAAAGLPLVSVVIPAYNAADYVLEAIASVRAQDYAALEIVLVDDGSQDGTAELVRAAAPEVRIVRQDNAGVAAARNTGLRAARGELICFLDADDGWFPGKLAAQVAYLRAHPEVGLVYHRWLVWRPDADGGYRPPPRPQVVDGGINAARSGWIYPQLLLDCIVHTSTVMIRREIAEAVGGFDPELKNGEDYHYWLCASRLCRIDQLAGVYSFYRAVPGSLTNRPKPVNYEYLVVERALREWGAAAPDGTRVAPRALARRLTKLAMDFGYGHYHGGSPRLAAQAYRTALRHDPLRWRAAVYWLAASLKALGGGGGR